MMMGRGSKYTNDCQFQGVRCAALLELKMMFRQRHQLIQALLMLTLLMLILRLAGQHFDPQLWQQWGLLIFWILMIWFIVIDVGFFWTADSANNAWEHWLPQPCALSIIRVKWSCYLFSRQLIFLVCLPLWFLIYQLNWHLLLATTLLLLVSLPIVVSLSLVISSLSRAFHQGAILLQQIVLPLFIPLVLYGSGILFAARWHHSYYYQLSGLLGLSLLFFLLCPFVIRAGLRLGIEA